MGKVIIIGAGLAGLICAKVLKQQGWQELLLLEKSDGPGGRVRTDAVDGFHLDRGFQVVFTAYPGVQRHLQLSTLNLRYYRPGAVLVKSNQAFLLGDPLRDVASWIPSLLNPLATPLDKLKILQLRAQLAQRSPEQVFQEGLGGEDLSIREFLHRYGFSPAICQHFFYPFYRGILLDPDLNSSACLFAFYFKMMAEGSIATPALGMGEITRQLANQLPPDQIRYHTEVEQIEVRQGQVCGVRTRDGEEIAADWVICATDALQAQVWQQALLKALLKDLDLSDHSARGLEQAPVPIPTQARSVTCLYFSAPFSLTRGGYIYLNASGQGWINNWVELTQISPQLAPAGQHLYSVVVLGDPPMSDVDLAQICRAELQDYFPKAPVEQLHLLRIYRIPFAQLVQLPGFQARLPRAFSGIRGLVWAGEYTQQSSIEGALRSGEQAAKWVLKGE
ncbi:MAG: NAD(P)/FAD-dependent oxidoreductase [Cyanobacteriota bacterium]